MALFVTKYLEIKERIFYELKKKIVTNVTSVWEKSSDNPMSCWNDHGDFFIFRDSLNFFEQLYQMK